MAKGTARVDIKSIVNNIGKQTKFIQPLYEAIVNSLEANATQITVNIEHDKPMENTVSPKIIGFSITDNGVGFTQKNREEFCKLWTEHKKAEFGCKGSGRYTWLSVFNTIKIKSNIVSENKIVSIPFSINFDEDSDIDIQSSKDINLNNSTTISFGDITSKFFDKQEEANLEKISKNVLEYLLIKLFLLKNSGKTFQIKFCIDNSETIINNDNITNLKLKEFSLINTFIQQGDNKIYFQLYYHFADGGNSKQAYYCANNRIVKNIENDSLGFHAPFPDNASLNMLLCSKYFDDKCNDTRDDFPSLMGNRNPNFDTPLLLAQIKAQMKIEMQKIIKARYPEMEEWNKREEEKAINSKPYLTEFILENNDIVKDEKSLTIYAQKRFNDEKENAQQQLLKALNDKSIDPASFLASIARVSAVAQKELGEYIVYRKEIITALNSAITDKSKNEDFIHNIFMQKNTSSKTDDTQKYLSNNLWLLDDKFMTYSYSASNKQMNTILTEIENENKKRNVDMGNKKPDIIILYNKETNKDLVIIEFKKAMATLGEKENAPTEIGRNIGIIRRSFGTDVSSIYGYIITSLDNEFLQSLKDNGYIELFSNAAIGKILYFYNKTNNAHIFAIDLEAITADAFARNKTFLDILKKK